MMLFEKKRYVRKNKRIVIYLFFIITFIFIRIVKLDVDLPAWGLINYQPMDEGQYATMALNKINYGSFQLEMEDNEVLFKTEPHVRNNIIGNIIIYLSLKIFGDNYYGLRISSVFTSICIFVLFVGIVFKLRKQCSSNQSGRLNNYFDEYVLCSFAFDFTFLIASRVVETTIFRLLFLMIVIYSFVAYKNESWYKEKGRFFLIGFFSTLSVFLVYITNIFLVIASFLFVIIYGKMHGKKAGADAGSYFIAGCGMAYVISELYYFFVWEESCLTNSIRILQAFSGTVGYIGGTNWTLFINFLSANCNLYNLGILFVFLLCIPKIIKNVKTDETLLYFIVVFLVFVGQLLVTEDYVVRKYILVYPIVNFILILMSKKENDYVGKKGEVGSVIYIYGCILGLIVIVYYRIHIIKNDTKFDFDYWDKAILYAQLGMVCVSGIILTLKKIFIRKRIIIGGIGIILSGCLVDIYFNTRYIICNDSYTEKKVMVDIGKVVGEDYVYGIFSPSFTLYNDIKPVVNSYVSLYEQMKTKNNSWYLDYENYAFPQDIMSEGNEVWEETFNYKREFSTFGKKRGVSLYTVNSIEAK